MSFFGKPSGGEPRITYERIDLTANDAVLAPAAPSFTTRPAPAATAVVRPAPTVEPPAMLIAADSELEGRLRSHGAVRIEGVLRGELVAASVMVAPGGLIEGLVTVEHAQIDGTLRGTVVARDVEISRTAMVDAELVYEEIGIARGARVHGLHRRREPEPAPRAEADALSLSVTAMPVPAEALEAAVPTSALVAAAEAALQELAEVAQAAAGASSELAQNGISELVMLEGELRDTAARLPLASPAL
ncbi:polymer-forming cytoskeletal protein [Pseudoroseomonas wenyumeiae]|uniref:Polymer-forming cytoskeletal protein n=1 Tax=Teichococcus wenyumeiae TaxID=2478470 RepID=A0A3A9JSG3_9PROT|nr:polymer-forming cytoskeletal protein [Pseudoroseomonas wenyumeiae]RKK03648.1 polymer-forming cytoskeletal protein [Pseudoroseomonas wenyumeiae]RMI20129.1 polymer-forming cytoskeletal protein [Pseudoroseomonas wenyumeiae]